MNVNINYITDGDIAGALSVIGINLKMIFITVQEVARRVYSCCCTFLLWWTNSRSISFR